MSWYFTRALFEGIRRHLSWVRSKHRLEHSVPNLIVGYRATALDCQFEGANRLGDESQAYASTFGRFTYYGGHTRINHTTVGRFCSIGSYVSLGLWSHPVGRNVSTHPVFHSAQGQAGGVSWLKETLADEFQKVKIGHDVWIGDFAMVRGGVTVGNGAVIGAGAVVTRDVPPYAIMAGVPAKIVRLRFTVDEIAWLESAKWWNMPEPQLRLRLAAFQDLNEFQKSA